MHDACPTITASGGIPGAAGITHPIDQRKFSIAELRSICSFPSDFILEGTYQQQAERLGRSVPPLMMKAVADVVRLEILDKARRA
jgi:DNA (cytosine-5)-methyltransferase 1